MLDVFEKKDQHREVQNDNESGGEASSSVLINYQPGDRKSKLLECKQKPKARSQKKAE